MKSPGVRCKISCSVVDGQRQAMRRCFESLREGGRKTNAKLKKKKIEKKSSSRVEVEEDSHGGQQVIPRVESHGVGHWATFPLIPKLVELIFEAQGRSRTCIPHDCDREKKKEGRTGRKRFFFFERGARIRQGSPQRLRHCRRCVRLLRTNLLVKG